VNIYGCYSANIDELILLRINFFVCLSLAIFYPNIGLLKLNSAPSRKKGSGLPLEEAGEFAAEYDGHTRIGEIKK